MAIAKAEEDYLSGDEKSLKKAVSKALTQGAGQYAFYAGTRALDLLVPGGSAVSWGINAAVDASEVVNGNWPQAIRGVRALNSERSSPSISSVEMNQTSTRARV